MSKGTEFIGKINDILQNSGGSIPKNIHLVNIPEKKLINARQKIAIPENEEIYILFDDTVFGSGKEGMVITSWGIRYNIAGETWSFSWEILKKQYTVCPHEKKKYLVLRNNKNTVLKTMKLWTIEINSCVLLEIINTGIVLLGPSETSANTDIPDTASLPESTSDLPEISAVSTGPNASESTCLGNSSNETISEIPVNTDANASESICLDNSSDETISEIPVNTDANASESICLDNSSDEAISEISVNTDLNASESVCLDNSSNKIVKEVKMNCRKCNAEIVENAKFCPECGTKVGDIIPEASKEPSHDNSSQAAFPEDKGRKTSEYFSKMSDKELAQEIKFHYNYTAWIILFVFIASLGTFLSAFITNRVTKTTEILYDSNITLKLMDDWFIVPEETTVAFISGLDEKLLVAENKHLFSDKNGNNFYLSIYNGLTKEEKFNLKADFKKQKSSIQKYKGTNWLPGDLSLEGYSLYYARRGNTLYTVISNLSDNTIIQSLNIKPFGLLQGFLDGLILPFQGLGSFFENSLHPVKKSNNGFSYVFGFIFGCILLLVIIISFCISISSDVSLKRSVIEKMERDRQAELAKRERDRQAELARREWERKWAAMSIDEKVDHITHQYSEAQAKNCKNLEKLNKKYSETTLKFEGNNPDTLLAEFDEQANTKSDSISNIGGFLINALTAGEDGLKIAKNRYEQLVDIYKYYEAGYKISVENLKIVNAEYNFIREKAILYMQKIKEFIAELPLKDRTIFDKLEGIKFNQGLLGNKSIQAVFKQIENLNKSYRIQAKKSFNKSMKAAGNIFNDTEKYLAKQIRKKKGNLSDDDLFVAGIGAAAGLITIAAEGVSQYLGNIGKTSEAKTRLAQGELKLRQGIEDIEKTHRPKVENLIERERELNLSLNESMERYIAIFNNVNSYLFPVGDQSKTKEARQRRKEEGEGYFAPDEFQRIMELREFNKFLGTLVDAEL